MPLSICCDFDGTICIPDSCDFLLERFADAEWKRLDEAVWRGALTEREAFPRQIELLRVTWADACRALADGVRLREGFADFAATCTARGIPLTILSSGLRPLIVELLQRAGIADVPVIAHGAEISGDRWQVIPWTGRRLAKHCSHCKCDFVQRERDAGRTVVYIGDGYTDLCPARRADVLFATGRLAQECAREGRDHFEFNSFFDIGRSLFHLNQQEQEP